MGGGVSKFFDTLEICIPRVIRIKEREPANCPNRGHSPQIRLTAGDEVLGLGWLCVSGAIPETVVVGEDLRAIWMRRRRRGEGGRRRSETEVKR